MGGITRRGTPAPDAAAPPFPPSNTDLIAPDARGLNFYAIDHAFGGLLDLHMPADLRRHMEPHLQRMGELAGGRLDELAELADKHPPVLHHRDRFGRDQDWVEFHPAYREIERIGFGDFGMQAMSRRAGVLDWPAPVPPIAKYAFQYLFVQAEFGTMCPISVSDTSALLIGKYGSEEIKNRFLPGMLSQDMDKLLKGAQFMTEKAGGSDVGNSALAARREGDHWRLYGDKWFCSCADADVALLLARPEGAPAGSKGLALFVMPRRLEDGSRNRYRIVRLKDKLGSRSMASGEIVFEGAVAYHLGRLDRGLTQMMDQVNLSRLSHGVRAAGMMRRCLNEALRVARNRNAFGQTIANFALMRRQLLKMLVPTEQALSVFTYTAATMEQADAGDPAAELRLRLLTPVLKFRACRDNIKVATTAMESRGGNGFIEDWVNARLVRDAHLGVLWEGTSNINALDVITRAVRRERAHAAMLPDLQQKIAAADGVPGQFRTQLRGLVERAFRFAEDVAADPGKEKLARLASSGLYHAISAALMAWEAAQLGARGGDARRLLLARFVLEQRLAARDPLAVTDDAWEEAAIDLLLDEKPVPLAQAADLVAG